MYRLAEVEVAALYPRIRERRMFDKGICVKSSVKLSEIAS
ncbi:hypothetical protein T12_7557 [Trichinella patagoniensis]|uniref:Uncharacterized protein n=1 Tax=Trichinella patagoniensis TaxID=990121 RepID=A0A0V0YTA7_9BILA|nr:hypothetical protein T12_7557 [Trichinella patagoniensis]